ncbi:hypothetical protein TNCV_3321371 [Trichonephila clavipes]|nr:hypothetical protein TNCV_3321371 [Trichonephila clavipes]
MSRLGGVVGLSLAFCTQGCGFDHGPSRWIFMMQKIDSGHVFSFGILYKIIKFGLKWLDKQKFTNYLKLHLKKA